MSLTRCDECEEFIDTDSDPDSCVGDRFICESCREDVAIDNHIHQTINALRFQNSELIRALKSFTQDVETDYMIDGKWVDKPTTMVKNNYENYKQILDQCGF